MDQPNKLEQGERAPLLPGSHNSFPSPKKVSINDEGAPLHATVGEATPKKTPRPREPMASPPGLVRGIGIMLFITFLSSVCFSIVLPSSWPYIQEIEGRFNRTAVTSQNGWTVAVNSLGSFIASPVVGAWGDRRGARESLGATLIIMIIGNLMYSLSVNFYMLLAARFIVGIACANYSVAQTYISYATNVNNRSLVMALNSASSVLGFILGPALATALNYLDYTVYGVVINPMTAPGYVAGLFAVIGLFSLFFLVEVPASYKKNKNKSLGVGSVGSGFYSGQGSIKDVSMILKMGSNKQIPRVAVGVCLWSYFAYTASFTTFETIGSAYTQDAFGWGPNNEGPKKNGILFALLGVDCVVALVFLQLFLKIANERIVVIGTTLLSIGGFALLVNLQGNHYVSLLRFSFGAVMGSAAYSVGASILVSIYSKHLENFDQGAMMGWMSSASSISRIVGPIVSSYTLEKLNASVVYLEIIGLTATMFLALVFAYKKLEPHDPAAGAEKKNINGN